MQSLDQLSALKPAAAPESPKYVQKLDKQGRAYATGKRKDAVARVWVKPGSGKIEINTRAFEVYFARPVLRMLIQQPLVATNRNGQFDIICTVSGGGLSGQAGAVRHGLSKALVTYEPDLRGPLKRAASSPATRAWSSVRSTARRKRAAASSSRSANRPDCSDLAQGGLCKKPAFRAAWRTLSSPRSRHDVVRPACRAFP